MGKLKVILTAIPECYLIVLALLSGYTPPLSLSPFAIGLAFLLILQVLFKNKITGIIIANLFILISLYMLVALFSEFKEFQTFDSGAKQLIFVGIPLIILNFFVAGLMIYKYLGKEFQNDSKINTAVN
ncbi:MAG: hypothetical protein JXB49_30565 [Bacteroidales bacterium]|nr:hypothetical protein [Bacteroidales bacterium]